MPFSFLRKKTKVKISHHLTAIDGQVIAREGQWLDENLEASLRERRPQGSDRVEELRETYHFFNLKVLLKEEKYKFLASMSERKDWLLSILGPIQINHLLDQELTWLERYKYHYDHALAVTLLVALMAAESNKDEDWTRDAAFCALTHDFGITRVPERILTKVSRLDEDERRILQEHPTYSYCLLTYYGYNDPFLNARVGFGHHEDPVGSGYPRGINQADELCQMVRICDIFDALISARPFRPAKTPDEALAILQKMVDESTLNPDLLNILNALRQTEIPA